MPEPIAEGHYYRKQLGCRSNVIAWSHRSRFRLGLELIGPAPGKLLDYGCGDGSFLAMAADRIDEGNGADVSPGQIEDCKTRFAGVANLKFCTVAELSAADNDARYDVVTCMETLEHCAVETVEVVLADLARLVAADGCVVISVPIETGPTFLLKLAVRKFAAWRNISDYKYYKRSTFPDAVKMIFANKSTTVDRSVHTYMGIAGHSHDGFNWRSLRERVRSHLYIERTLFSPLGFSRGLLSSQAWFVCRPQTSGKHRF